MTAGTTILEAVEARACNGCVIHSPNGGEQRTTDVALAVVSEEPYAEMHGDAAGSAIGVSSSFRDRKCLQRLRAADNLRPIVLLVLSGRPLDLSDYYAPPELPTVGRQGVEAIVALFLPGSEAQGVVDVLYGDTPFSGRLPLQWGDADGRVAFAIGHGLGLDQAAASPPAATLSPAPSHQSIEQTCELTGALVQHRCQCSIIFDDGGAAHDAQLTCVDATDD
jgi:beta-glucosidase